MFMEFQREIIQIKSTVFLFQNTGTISMYKDLKQQSQ